MTETEFTPERREELLEYTDVVVCRKWGPTSRRAGTYAVYASQPVHPDGGPGLTRYGRPRRLGARKIYHVTGFVGTQAQAVKAAYQIAQLLREGREPEEPERGHAGFGPDRDPETYDLGTPRRT